ncbi:hypothetical protein CVS40_8529 [Lucilia cuprina]|nr:hypothetical protein CVS40_8529 [Lucilia cuprina]
MSKITHLVFTLILVAAEIRTIVGSQLAYNADYGSPIHYSDIPNCDSLYGYAYEAPFAAPLPVAPIAAPLPVAPLAAPHRYAAVSYSAPPIFRYRSRGFRFAPFNSYVALRPHHKFAYPAPVPSFYNAPPSVSYGSPAITYNGFATPNTVVKFGPPITTTTTTYSATAAAAATVPAPQPLNAVGGW